MATPKRSFAAALGWSKAQGNRYHVPTLNEMLEANCSARRRTLIASPLAQRATQALEKLKETQNLGKHEHDAKFVCTACGRSVAIVEVRAHPVLHVGICKNCYDYQVSDPFTKDNPQDPFWHENECRWCGDGGEVILCNSCPKVFCKHCIKRNFGEEILSAIESSPQKWSCFVCNDDHVQILIRDYMQTTLISDLMQTLIGDYNNVQNLVKTTNGRSQPQKCTTSRFEVDSTSIDEENNNDQSTRSFPLHHEGKHKKAFNNDYREDHYNVPISWDITLASAND